VTTFSTIDGFNKAEAAIFPVQAMIFEDSLISQITSNNLDCYMYRCLHKYTLSI